MRHLTSLIFLILVSCAIEQPTKKMLFDKSNGVKLVAEHLVGPALSQPEDKLYIFADGRRKLIFEGYGGSSLSLRSSQKGTLIIAYCGGSIKSAQSFLVNDRSSGSVVAVRIQPIVASGLQIDGVPVCDPAWNDYGDTITVTGALTPK